MRGVKLTIEHIYEFIKQTWPVLVSQWVQMKMEQGNLSCVLSFDCGGGAGGAHCAHSWALIYYQINDEKANAK